jgi:hypothetical protein
LLVAKKLVQWATAEMADVVEILVVAVETVAVIAEAVAAVDLTVAVELVLVADVKAAQAAVAVEDKRYTRKENCK